MSYFRTTSGFAQAFGRCIHDEAHGICWRAAIVQSYLRQDSCAGLHAFSLRTLVLVFFGLYEHNSLILSLIFCFDDEQVQVKEGGAIKSWLFDTALASKLVFSPPAFAVDDRHPDQRSNSFITCSRLCVFITGQCPRSHATHSLAVGPCCIPKSPGPPWRQCSSDDHRLGTDLRRGSSLCEFVSE
jgi:hypothetical protein